MPDRLTSRARNDSVRQPQMPTPPEPVLPAKLRAQAIEKARPSSWAATPAAALRQTRDRSSKPTSFLKSPVRQQVNDRGVDGVHNQLGQQANQQHQSNHRS